MEQTSSSKYYRHIQESTNDIIKYIDDRRTGKTYSLRTSWPKLNNLLCGGFEPNTLTTICGISGSGKSSFVNNLETSLIENNPWANIAVLSLNYEMMDSKQVGRKLSTRLKMTTSELYSGRIDNKINDQQYNEIIEQSKKIANYPIYYANIPGDVEHIKQTILHFMKNEGKGKWVVIILDHTLLVRGKESELKTLPDLQKLFMELKKYGRNTIIQLSQLNRNIESPDRIGNMSMHFPTRADIYGSDQVYHASDVVIVLHRPEILGIRAYGLDALPTDGIIYAHVLKQREGEVGVIPFRNILKYNQLEEINNFNDLLNESKNDSELLFNN